MVHDGFRYDGMKNMGPRRYVLLRSVLGKAGEEQREEGEDEGDNGALADSPRPADAVPVSGATVRPVVLQYLVTVCSIHLQEDEMKRMRKRDKIQSQ